MLELMKVVLTEDSHCDVSRDAESWRSPCDMSMQGTEGRPSFASNQFATGQQKEMGGPHHFPAVLFQGKNRNPLYRRLGGPQGRSGRYVTSDPHRDGIPKPFSRSESLYWLRYPAVK